MMIQCEVLGTEAAIAAAAVGQATQELLDPLRQILTTQLHY